jgi:hypothetical protein
VLAERVTIVRYGRSEQEWARLAEVGKKFLVERAVQRRTTSYTEFNAALVNRVDTAGFNFDLDADRAAIGEPLGQIPEDALAETGGLLISALVQYLDTNDAGPASTSLPGTRASRSPGEPMIAKSSGPVTSPSCTSTMPAARSTRRNKSITTTSKRPLCGM